MRNKNFFKVLIIAVALAAALPAFCAPAVPIRQTAVKFLIAMGGVAFSSLIIFAGLSLYNKLFAERSSIKFEKEDLLSTPDNTEDAVSFFIKKNKLR